MERKVTLPYDIKQFTNEDLQLLNDVVLSLMYILPLHSKIGQVVPRTSLSRNGMLAYADGVNWNPNSDGLKGLKFHDGTTWRPIAQLSNGESVLSANVTLNLTLGTYQEIPGISLSLPAGGIYLVTAEIRTYLGISSGTYGLITGKFFNSTDGTDITNSQRLLGYIELAGNTYGFNGPMSSIVDLRNLPAKTIKLYAKRDSNGVMGITQVTSDANGYTAMRYVRIG